MGYNCPDCGKEIKEPHDETYANYNNGKVYAGQHTGNIYYCPDCQLHFIHILISDTIMYWDY